jgi:protease PrsW
MSLLILSIAPVFILLAYVYFRDKYEKEPIGLILRGLLAGVIIIFPVALIERGLTLISPLVSGLQKAAYDGFIVAGATEELFKFGAVYLLFWKNRNFNEKFDGIVYAVSVSLGFAAIENLFYVYDGSVKVGLLRAITAVPGHTLFGVLMGYYLGLAKFIPSESRSLLWKSFYIPMLFHGTYDFLILSNHPVLMLCFIPFMIILWVTGLKRMRKLNEVSVFRNNPPPPPGSYANE